MSSVREAVGLPADMAASNEQEPRGVFLVVMIEPTTDRFSTKVPIGSIPMSCLKTFCQDFGKPEQTAQEGRVKLLINKLSQKKACSDLPLPVSIL